MPSRLSVGWIGNDAITPIIGEHDPYIHIYGRVSIIVTEFLYIYSVISPSLSLSLHWWLYHVNLTNRFRFQELTHLRVVTVLMTSIMVVAILTSIAIVRRILMATSVLKASVTLSYAWAIMHQRSKFIVLVHWLIFDSNYVYF